MALLAVAAARENARAQSAVFNVPTTDTLPPQKITIEVDYIAHPDSYEKGGFHYFGPVLIYGLRKNVEIGLNAYYTRSSGPNALELQPNAKWRFYNDEDGFSAAVGGIAVIPLKNREAISDKAMLYVNASKQFRGDYGPRFTTGVYGFVGRMEEGENRSGLMLGYEQPLSSRLTFVADWLSGNNVFGYAAAGLNITLPRDSYLFAGYSFGNRGRANNWLAIFYGRTF